MKRYAPTTIPDGSHLPCGHNCAKCASTGVVFNVTMSDGKVRALRLNAESLVAGMSFAQLDDTIASSWGKVQEAEQMLVRSLILMDAAAAVVVARTAKEEE